MQFMQWIIVALTIGTAAHPISCGIFQTASAEVGGGFRPVSVVRWVRLQDAVSAPRPSQRPAVNCVKFSSPDRLHEGTVFTVAVAADLELRLRPDGVWGWGVAVGPQLNASADYLWVVSPPFQTAPHRTIGAGYGVTARESAQFERRFRFVLNATDYQTAVKIVKTEQASEAKLAKLDALGRGTVQLRITDFRIREHVKTAPGSEIDAFDWIRFEGKICVPR
jgi:hypothetical protein